MKIMPAAINCEQPLKAYSVAEQQPVAKIADVQSASKLASALQTDLNLTNAGASELTSYAEIAKLVEKIIFNGDFKELNIDQNSELKAAYEEFISSLKISASDLKEYMSKYAGDKTKFSEELLSKLNAVIKETSASDIKAASTDFLKALDSYFTRKSDLDGLLSVYLKAAEGFTANTRDKLIDLLYASDGKNLEKLVEKITALLTSEVIVSDVRKLEVMFNTMLNKLGMLFEYLDKSNSTLTAKTDAFVQDISQALKDADKSGLPDYLTKKIETMLAKYDNLSAVSDKTSAPIEAEQKLSGGLTTVINGVKSAYADNEADISALKETVSDIADKILSSLKDDAAIDTSSTADAAAKYISKLKEEIGSTDDPLNLIGLIKNEFFPAMESYAPDESTGKLEELSRILSKLLDAVIREKIYENDAGPQISKEVVADIIERSVLPHLLSSNNQEVRSLTSFLTHSLMRIKSGDEQSVLEKTDELFDKLSNLPLKDLLDIKYELAKMIKKYAGTFDTRLQSLSKLLTAGIEHSSNSANARVFDNILMSLLAKNSIDNPYRYTFLPFCYNEIYVISEIWISDKNDGNKREKSKKRRSKNESESLKIFIPFEIENEGYFESFIVTSEDLVYLEILLPEKYQEYSDTIKEGMKEILEKHNLLPGMVSITNVPGPRSPDEVFSSLIPNGESVAAKAQYLIER